MLTGAGASPARAATVGDHDQPRGSYVSNLKIANIFLFITILCLALSAQMGAMRSVFFSLIGIVLAGMMRHTELHRTGNTRQT